MDDQPTRITIEYISIDEIKRWPRNPKDHDLGALHQSFDKFGYVEPMLRDERTGQLVAGHGRLDTLFQKRAEGQAAPDGIIVENGTWKVPVIRGKSFRSTAQAEAYLLASNRLVELGGWIEEDLAGLLQELAEEGELDGSGFDGDDLEQLLEDLKRGEESSDDSESPDTQTSEDDDDQQLITCPHCGHQWLQSIGATIP